MFQMLFALIFQWFVDLSSLILSFVYWECIFFCLSEIPSHNSSKPCVVEICCKLTIVPIFILVTIVFSLYQVRVSGCITGSLTSLC